MKKAILMTLMIYNISFAGIWSLTFMSTATPVFKMLIETRMEKITLKTVEINLEIKNNLKPNIQKKEELIKDIVTLENEIQIANSNIVFTQNKINKIIKD
jgi:hypothetical protein